MDKLKIKIIKKLHRKDYGRAYTFGDFNNLADNATLRRAYPINNFGNISSDVSTVM